MRRTSGGFVGRYCDSYEVNEKFSKLEETVTQNNTITVNWGGYLSTDDNDNDDNDDNEEYVSADGSLGKKYIKVDLDKKILKRSINHGKQHTSAFKFTVDENGFTVAQILEKINSSYTHMARIKGKYWLGDYGSLTGFTFNTDTFEVSPRCED